MENIPSQGNFMSDGHVICTKSLHDSIQKTGVTTLIDEAGEGGTDQMAVALKSC